MPPPRVVKATDPPVTTPGVSTALNYPLAFFDATADITGSGNLQWSEVLGYLLLNGRLGVGTTSPGYVLDVEGYATGGVFTKASAGHNAQYIMEDGNSTTIWLYFANTSGQAGIYDSTNSKQPLTINPNINTTLTLNSTGVQISPLPAAGGSIVYESGGVLGLAAPSDVRLKKNIRPIRNALDKIQRINGVTFNWKHKTIDHGMGRRMGVLAQDVMKVAPELVYKQEVEGKEYLGVEYEHIAPLLIEALKEQQKQIQALQREVAELKRHG